MLNLIAVQRLCGWICLLPLNVLIILLLSFRVKYSITRHADIRSRFLELTKKHKHVVVCSNHLTLIDSVVLLWAFASPVRYCFNYRLFCWNLPAVENAKKKLSWIIITYLNKCILVDRFGDATHTGKIIDKICKVIRGGDLFMIFPEGTRSRSGKVETESVTYGIGKILERIPDCKVLCVYQRGQHQNTYSDFPSKNEVFDIDMQLISPATDKVGLRAIKDLSHQVITKIKQMEVEYLEQRTAS